MKILIAPRPIQEKKYTGLDKDRTFDIMKLYKPYDFLNMIMNGDNHGTK